MQKDKVPVHCAEASVDEGQEAGNTGGAAVCACITGPLERIAAALEELVRATKEKENLPPTPPIRKKENTPSTEPRTRARFVKPTVEEMAAYIAEKGYAFDAEDFYNFYESNGWRVGKNPMKNWKAACATWQKIENQRGRYEAHLDAKMDEREEKRQAHLDAKMHEREKRFGGRRKADNNVEMSDEVREEVRRDFAL